MSQLTYTTAEYKQLLKGGKNIKEQKEPGMRPAPKKNVQPAPLVPPSIRKRVREINAGAKILLARVSPLCYARGWDCDTARHFTTDERDRDFPSIRDDAATPNCLVIWRKDDMFVPFGRMKMLMWLWEDLSEAQLVQRLQRVEEVRTC